MQRLHSLDTLWVENFDEIALSRTVKEIEGNLCFSIFGKNSKWPPFLGRGKFFKNCQGYNGQIPCGLKMVENFDEIALSRMVKEIQANLCFAIFGKYSKIQNSRHFWGGENFWKIAKITFLRYPVGENFDEIALSRTVKEIEPNSCFAIFGKNSKIQNGRHFWGGKIF